MARIKLSGIQIPTVSKLNIDGELTLDAQSGTSGQILTSAGSGNTPTWNSAISISGDITTSGKLFVNASAGDEGGEIFLKKPVTGTSIVNGVNIDVYQNRLRIWEDGGTNRGVYIDMTTAGTGVGTNLLGTATDTNYYPSAIVFNAGTTSGPTLDLTMSGSGAPDLTAVAIPSAGASASGIVTTGSQTFAGTKTFSSSIDTPGIARSGTSTLALSTAAAATSTGAISLTSGNVTSAGTSGAINIDVGSSVGGGGPGAINIGTTNASAVNVKNLKVSNGGLFEYSGYSTTSGSTTLTNVPGTYGYATNLPSILTAVTTGNATTNTGSVGAEFRASLTTTTHLITFSSGTTARGSISTNSTTTTYSTSSDYRLKENVQPITGAVNRLMLLKPSRFNFIEFPERIVDGFIAHEAQEVVPESVVGDKDQLNEDGSPAYQGIDQAKLVPLLTAALQEAVSKIEALETRIEALENN